MHESIRLKNRWTKGKSRDIRQCYHGLMKRVMFMIVSGVLALLLESSFGSLPWVLVFAWFWWDVLEIKRMLWICLLVGVFIDALTLRNLGVMSVLLLVFVSGMWFLRKSFAGLFWVELSWALVILAVWSVLFVGLEWWILPFGVVVGLMIEIKKRMGLTSEIRLR